MSTFDVIDNEHIVEFYRDSLFKLKYFKHQDIRLCKLCPFMSTFDVEDNEHIVEFYRDSLFKKYWFVVYKLHKAI